jgi:eukaryotic-like serine/threonine-protein kinase
MTYQAGHKLGNYHLIRQLGRGGFAEVYLGKHIYLNTQAAIKVLQVQLSNEALEKFLHEARLIASLEHPHIVRVLEFGIEEHRPFLAMSYAPRGTLRRYVSGPQAPAFILPYVKQAAAALQYAHERKIVHSTDTLARSRSCSIESAGESASEALRHHSGTGEGL